MGRIENYTLVDGESIVIGTDVTIANIISTLNITYTLNITAETLTNGNPRTEALRVNINELELKGQIDIAKDTLNNELNYSGINIITSIEENKSAINIPSGTKLIIASNDTVAKLTCIGKNNSFFGGAAGIGGNYSCVAGSIFLQGTGTIEAQGGEMSAGIGGGAFKGLEKIYISEGVNVIAVGGNQGAGVGGGSKSVGGIIEILDSANVTARGGNLAAGIGGAGVQGNGGTIKIAGSGTIKATGGDNGAGIGGGSNGAGGIIEITSEGTIVATGLVGGAGIGGGDSGEGGIIKINGTGSVTATGNSGGAGIGGGSGKNGTIIEIKGTSNITAIANYPPQSVAAGAGIGGGADGNGGKIIIGGTGVIKAKGNVGGDDIGNGGRYDITKGQCTRIITNPNIDESVSIPNFKILKIMQKDSVSKYIGSLYLRDKKDSSLILLTSTNSQGEIKFFSDYSTQPRLFFSNDYPMSIYNTEYFDNNVASYLTFNSNFKVEATLPLKLDDDGFITIPKEINQLIINGSENVFIGNIRREATASGDFYIQLKNVKLQGFLELCSLQGVTTINIVGENKIFTNDEGKAAIHVLENRKLIVNIEENSLLNVTGGRYAAGIGGNNDETGGNINIFNTGDIKITAGEKAAGIGGGYKGTSGAIMIIGFGEVIVSKGSNESEDIGSGEEGNITESLNRILIGPRFSEGIEKPKLSKVNIETNSRSRYVGKLTVNIYNNDFKILMKILSDIKKSYDTSTNNIGEIWMYADLATISLQEIGQASTESSKYKLSKNIIPDIIYLNILTRGVNIFK